MVGPLVGAADERKFVHSFIHRVGNEISSGRVG